MSTLTNWAAIFTGVIALETLFYVIVTWRLLNATKQAAEAAKDSAEAVRRSVEVMTDTAERQLRAYVCVSTALLKFYGPNQFEAQITFKNRGQTPAYKVDHRILTWIGRRATSYADLPQPTNLEIDGEAVTLGSGEAIILTQMRESWTDIPEGPLGTPEKNIYAYGIVTYEDAFKKHRHTKFCLIWGGVTGGRMTTRNGERWGVLQTYSGGNDST